MRRELLQNYYSKPAKARIHAGCRLVAFTVNYGAQFAGARIAAVLRCDCLRNAASAAVAALR